MDKIEFRLVEITREHVKGAMFVLEDFKYDEVKGNFNFNFENTEFVCNIYHFLTKSEHNKYKVAFKNYIEDIYLELIKGNLGEHQD